MALTKVTYSMIQGAPINVNDYGAVGDGTTDDTIAIQTALEAGLANNSPVVGVANKTYLVSQLSLDATNAICFIENLNLFQKANSDVCMLLVNKADFVTINNCTFNGNKANQAKILEALVSIQRAANVTITNSSFFDGSFHGLEVFKCRNVFIDTNKFYQNGKTDSSYPADGMSLTIANGTISNNICYLNNTTTGGDNIDGDGIQLNISGSTELPYWDSTTDLKGIVRLENNLCYSNGRRGIKDQRGNTEVVNNSCWGNNIQLSIVQASTISNFYYSGNILGRAGDTYVNCFFLGLVDPAPAVLENLTFVNNKAIGDVTNNDAFRFGGLNNATITGNTLNGSVTAPYKTYGVRDANSDTVYLAKEETDTFGYTVVISNLWTGNAFEELAISGSERTSKSQNGAMQILFQEYVLVNTTAEQVITLPDTFVGDYFVSCSPSTDSLTAGVIAALLSAKARQISSTTIGITLATTHPTATTYLLSIYAFGSWK